MGLISVFSTSSGVMFHGVHDVNSFYTDAALFLVTTARIHRFNVNVKRNCLISKYLETSKKAFSMLHSLYFVLQSTTFILKTNIWYNKNAQHSSEKLRTEIRTLS